MAREQGSRGSAVMMTVVLALGLLVAACRGSAAPSLFFPPPSPTPTPTLTPEEAAARTTLDALATLVAREDLSFHVVILGTEKVNNVVLPSTEERLDVSGLNFAGSLRLDDRAASVVYLDGITWAKTGTTAWKRSARFSPADAEDISNVWRILGDIGALEFVRRDAADPDRLEFRNAGPISFADNAMLRTGAHATVDTLTLFLHADGTPIGYRTHMVATYISGGMAEQKHDISSIADFTKVGEPVIIKAPK
ncbi:MAG: hypothetical protein WCK58_16730 [Chloroflexota bacterium]